MVSEMMNAVKTHANETLRSQLDELENAYLSGGIDNNELMECVMSKADSALKEANVSISRKGSDGSSGPPRVNSTDIEDPLTCVHAYNCKNNECDYRNCANQAQAQRARGPRREGESEPGSESVDPEWLSPDVEARPAYCQSQSSRTMRCWPNGSKNLDTSESVLNDYLIGNKKKKILIFV